MWLIMLSASLGVVISIGYAASLDLLAIGITLLFALVFLIAIYYEANSPKSAYGLLLIAFLAGRNVIKTIDNQSAMPLGLVYFLSVCLVVYSAHKIYLKTKT